MDWVSEDLMKSKMSEELKNQQPAEMKEQLPSPTPQSEEGMSFEDTLQVMELAYTHMLQGRFDEAESITSAFLALIPDFWYLHSLMGVIHLQAVLAEDPSGKFSLEVAEKALNRAIELNPADISTYVNRAEVLLFKGNLPGSLDSLKQVKVLDPKGENPYSARAQQFAAQLIKTLEKMKAEKEAAKA